MTTSLITRLSQEFRSLATTMVHAIVRPAVVVADGANVVAANAAWRELVGHADASGRHATLAACLGGFTGADALLGALEDGAADGIETLIAPKGAAGKDGGAQYSVRWRQLDLPHLEGSCAVLVLEDRAEVQQLVSVVNAQRIQIDQLLVRQTMIEEAARRHVGQALHDDVIQSLALVRNRLVRDDCNADARAALIPLLDHVIEKVRSMVFELSPPVLAELGLLPALAWLVEDLDSRYGGHVAFASDDQEPDLSPTAKTILYRAVRELAMNAVKHAPDAEVVITCESNARAMRAIVRDTGPGFDSQQALHSRAASHYGLFSVEQQLRGIGATFALHTSPGEGTRATITMPLGQPEAGTAEAAHG